MNATDLKSRLKHLIASKACSQSLLAKKTGVSQAQISKIINFDVDPRFSTVVALWPLLDGDTFPRMKTPEKDS